jgi:group I intron endonuclease
MAISKEEWYQVKSLQKKLQSPGIYAVINIVTGRFYIGSTKNLYKRKSHYSSAFNGVRSSSVKPLLNREFQKYGRASFVFRVLEYVKQDEIVDEWYLENIENSWILAAHDLAYNSHVFNQRRVRVNSIKRNNLA